MLPATDKQVQDTHPAKARALRATTHFPLLRRFSIVSLVVMLFTAIILVLLYQQDQIAEHKIISRDENERTLIYLTSSIDEQIYDFVTRSAGLSVQALSTNTSLDSLFSSGLKAINEDDILKLKIYNPAGMTIYSSAKRDIGGTSLHPDLLARALHGETVHHMEHVDTFPGEAGEMQDLNISMSYMPLTHAGKIIGAIEIYDDATQLYKHIFTNTKRIVLVVFGAFGALYAALFFSLFRTDRSIVKWQDTLSENEKALREAQIIAGLGSIVLNISSGLWKSSDALDKLFGINESYERSINGWIALIHPDDREMMADYFKNEVLGQGKFFDKDYRIIRRNDQAVRWMHELGKLEFDAHGHPHKMHGTIQDITERKQMEIALQESESDRHMLEKQKIVQTSLDGFWMVNAKSGQFMEVNDNYCKTLGYSREEILAMSIQDLEAQETPDETEAHLKKIREIGYDRFETRHRHKQGHLVDFEVSVSHSEENGGTNFAFFRDITERKMVEKTIRESENKFRILFESATDCILILGLNGCIQDINHTGHERLGYTKKEMLGKRISQFDPPGFAAKVAGRMEEIQTKGYATFESAHVRKDGSVMPVEINARTIELDGQQRVLSLVRDITTRKQAEELLSQSEANLRAMLDNSPYLSWLKDTEGRYITINKLYAARLRLGDPMRAIGKTDLDLQPQELAEKYRADDAEVMATCQQKHVEEQAFDGKNIHWVETYKTPIIDKQGKILGTVGFAKDITKRKNFERIVSDSEKKFRLLAESMPQIVWISQPDGQNIYINQKWVHYTGRSLEASYGDGWLNFFYPDDALQIKKVFQNALNSNGSFSLECRIRDADEKYSWWLVRGVPIPDETGNIQQWYGTCTDIKDIKQAEHDLRVAAVTVQDIMESNNQLTQEVTKRNADLTALTAHIQKVAETEKASLARELHDELGSILSGLSMEIGQLRMRVPDPDLLPDFSTIKDLISSASNAKQNIINQLYPTFLDDFGFVHAVKLMIKEYSKHAGINVELDLPKGYFDMEPTYALAAYRITQECLTNIAKHAGASKVRIEAVAQDGFLNLTIHDNGKGLPDEISANRHGIFGMVERSRYLGGSMKVGSEKGNGTTARLILPLAVASQNNKKRVLVVDDHSIIRDALRQLLETQTDDFSVEGEAADGKAAVQMAIEGEWDIMLLDINLPKKNGMKVLEEVLAAKPDLPIIMLSSHTEDEYAETSILKGAACYIGKGETGKLVKAMRQATAHLESTSLRRS